MAVDAAELGVHHLHAGADHACRLREVEVGRAALPVDVADRHRREIRLRLALATGVGLVVEDAQPLGRARGREGEGHGGERRQGDDGDLRAPLPDAVDASRGTHSYLLLPVQRHAVEVALRHQASRCARPALLAASLELSARSLRRTIGRAYPAPHKVVNKAVRNLTAQLGGGPAPRGRSRSRAGS